MPMTGLPRPLPECTRCGVPLPRAVWRTRRTCRDCATTAELIAAAHTRADLKRVTAATNARVITRIEALAAKRAARSTTTEETHP